MRKLNTALHSKNKASAPALNPCVVCTRACIALATRVRQALAARMPERMRSCGLGLDQRQRCMARHSRSALGRAPGGAAAAVSTECPGRHTLARARLQRTALTITSQSPPSQNLHPVRATAAALRKRATLTCRPSEQHAVACVSAPWSILSAVTTIGPPQRSLHSLQICAHG